MVLKQQLQLCYGNKLHRATSPTFMDVRVTSLILVDAGQYDFSAVPSACHDNSALLWHTFPGAFHHLSTTGFHPILLMSNG